MLIDDPGSSPDTVKYIWIIATCFVFVLVGCNNKVTVIGKWKIDMDHLPNGPTEADRAIADQVTNLSNIEFGDDNVFAADGEQGTYTFVGNKVTLKVVKAMGMDISASPIKKKPLPLEADLSADGQTLTFHLYPPATLKGTMKDLIMLRNTGP